MRIDSIRLRNFRIFEDATITLDRPLNILRGANHQGKSSVAHSLQLSLSKRADGTDQRGAGANDKIRTGTSKAIIDTRISGRSGIVDLTVNYAKGGRTQSIVVPDGDQRVSQGFASYLDANVDRLGCVLDWEYFTNPKTDQKTILASLVLPTTHEFPAELVELAEKRLGEFVWNKPPVAVIDQVYAAAYKERTTAKAVLGSIQIPATPEKPRHDAATVQGKLQELRDRAAAEAKPKPSGSVDVGRLEERASTILDRVAKDNADLSQAHLDIASLNGDTLDSGSLKRHERQAAARTLFNDLEARIQETISEIQSQKDAQAIYLELLEDEEGNPKDNPCCPTCTQAITKAFIDGKVAIHKAKENEYAEQQMSLMDEQRALGDIAGAEAALTRHRAAVDKKRDLQQKTADLSASIAKAKEELATIEKSLAAAKQSIAAEEPEDNSALLAVNAEIAQWEQLLTPAINYDNTLVYIEQQTAQKEKQQAIVNDLEKLCREFGKDGMKAKLIADHVGAFTDTVNAVLQVWGYSAELSIEPYEFLVTSKQGTLPLKELSGSEKLIFGVALQTAIAVHSKIRMVVVDKADTLINGERGRLFGCLKTLLQDQKLEQAIVMVSDDRTEIPADPGAAFFRVQEGKVDRL